MTKHAVLTDTHIVYISQQARKLEKVPLTQVISHISELWALGKEMGISHWWVMPDTLGAEFVVPRDGYRIFIPGKKNNQLEEGEMPRSAACGKGFGLHSFEVVVQWPTHPAGFAWAVNHPLDVLATVDYLSQMLGTTSIEYSPQHLGELFLKSKYKTTERLKSYIRKPEHLEVEPFKRAGREILFTRPFTPDMVGKYLHFYDKNAAHPSAASSMVTGCGEPVHLSENIEAKLPGVYRVTYSKSPATVFDGVNLPEIIAAEWVTLDILKFAVKNGYTVNIHEAYVFEQKHNIFGEWVRDLWQIRQVLKDETAFVYKPGRVNAYYTVKQIMNATISVQPNINWWADMVGLARVARLANFQKFAGEGQYPAIVYVDDVAYVSADENPATAVPGILDRQDKLGGFKHKYTIELTEQVLNEVNAITSHRPGKRVGMVHTYFKRLAEEKGLING